MYATNLLIDYSKGLTAEERKDLCVNNKIRYVKIKAGDIAAKGSTSGASVQTATPAKQGKDRERLSKSRDGKVTVANSVKTYDSDTTVGRDTEDNEGESPSSGKSLDSVDMEVHVQMKETNKESGKGDDEIMESEEGELEMNVDPPNTRRSSRKEEGRDN